MITGKDVYEAASPLLAAQGLASPEWDHAPQMFYEGIADWLNASHIAPLQALLKDYQEFTKYQTPLLKRGRLEWEAESNTLCKRATELLKEEH